MLFYCLKTLLSQDLDWLRINYYNIDFKNKSKFFFAYYFKKR